MAYSDSRWDEVKAGRVYPRETDPLTGAFADVRAKLDPRAAFARNRRRAEALAHEPLVKPAAYKALNESNVSGPSAIAKPVSLALRVAPHAELRFDFEVLLRALLARRVR